MKQEMVLTIIIISIVVAISLLLVGIVVSKTKSGINLYWNVICNNNNIL